MLVALYAASVVLVVSALTPAIGVWLVVGSLLALLLGYAWVTK